MLLIQRRVAHSGIAEDLTLESKAMPDFEMIMHLTYLPTISILRNVILKNARTRIWIFKKWQMGTFPDNSSIIVKQELLYFFNRIAIKWSALAATL